MRRNITILSVLLIGMIVLTIVPVLSDTSAPSVLLVPVEGTIDQSTFEQLTEANKQAHDMQAEAIILLLDTPGGALQQTFDINDLVFNNDIPVIGYVYPQGSYAWSAGTFILLNCHIAAMSPETVIGSCHPVTATGESINDNKTINALVEYLVIHAGHFGRNTTLARLFITENTNVDEDEALSKGVIEYIADDVTQLLIEIDNTTVTLTTGEEIVHTKGAEQITYQPSLALRAYDFLSDPLISSVLLLVGILAFFLGISSPGMGAEIFGGIAILLGLIGMGFSISVISILLLLIGCALLLVELFVLPGFGVAGIGGIICLTVGAIFLIPTYNNGEWLISAAYTIDLLIILAFIAILVSIFFGFLIYKILEIRKKESTINTFEGQMGITLDRITPEHAGYIRYHGEYWKAISEETIEVRTEVRILKKEDGLLHIEPIDEPHKG